jgi:predicted nucleic acid-binding protein
MATDGPMAVVLDSSVLINFLAVGRMDLFTAGPRRAYIITGHVIGEIVDIQQQAALREALRTDAFIEENVAIDSPAGDLFVRLTSERRLGVGECAAIAYACTHNLALAIDDKAAQKAAIRACPDLVIIGTENLMVRFIREGLLDVAQADLIKKTWETHHRFRLPFESFREKTDPTHS